MVMGYEGARIPGDVEPGVVVHRQACQVLGPQRGGAHDRAGHRIQDDLPQFAHARFGPVEEVEAALEHLLLRYVAWGRVPVLIVLGAPETAFPAPS